MIAVLTAGPATGLTRPPPVAMIGATKTIRGSLMHARSGAFQLSVDRLDAGLEAFRTEQLPRYKGQSGYKGFTLLANRQSGKVIGISFWESESDLRASDELGKQAREGIQQQGGGHGDIVRDEWAVVIDDMQ